jgi:MFS family permease
VLIFVFLTMVGEGVFATLLAPFVAGMLRGTGVEYGLFLGLQAVGGILGSMLIVARGHGRAVVRLLPLTAVVFGILDAAIFTYPVFWPTLLPALVLIGLVGLPAAAVVAGLTTLQQTAVPDALRGRFLGAVGTTGSVAMVLGILLASALADRVGILPLLEVQASVYIAGGLLLHRLRAGASGLRRAPESVPG